MTPPIRSCLSIARLAATAAALCAGTAAHATGTFPTGLAEADQRRLQQYDTVREAAVAEARAKGSAADIAQLDQALAGNAARPERIAGEWRCRTFKLGGLRPLTVYGWFRCRITEDVGGLRLRKLTGSQRTAGTFYDVPEARLGYAGATALAGEAPRRYGDDASRNDVGYLYQTGPNHLRLEIPSPARESRFDILELVR
ncbi:hypothetical protein CDO44_13825 [Pigmentiphaga sp. NML080357]|uniref:DUF4893 domain-containing protein n=1 Tax=Pigmentiphaga sp. NML080357 TaxID=2008675 RepID=UPI000B40C5D6|nr:DUF4893 domain-containing protein [Pigmentiphaga sp. NML080357]OVZ58777.1 hypothetical protein CDO44_13825 [Pigmentiphaga sp. NML080357]